MSPRAHDALIYIYMTKSLPAVRDIVMECPDLIADAPVITVEAALIGQGTRRLPTVTRKT